MIHTPPVLPDEPPLVAEVFNHSPDPSQFVPASRVRLGTGIRRLAASLPAERLKDVIILASFATTNGRIAGTSALAVGRALGIPIWQARIRLLSLSLTVWEGEPLVRVHRTKRA